VLFAKNKMPPFERVLVVIGKRRHTALRRPAGPRNLKRLRWNASVQQTTLGPVSPMRETVGDESLGTG
jgi:hypothetical protein